MRGVKDALKGRRFTKEAFLKVSSALGVTMPVVDQVTVLLGAWGSGHRQRHRKIFRHTATAVTAVDDFLKSVILDTSRALLTNTVKLEMDRLKGRVDTLSGKPLSQAKTKLKKFSQAHMLPEDDSVYNSTLEWISQQLPLLPRTYT